MHRSVAEIFPFKFSSPLEGCFANLYPDSIGLLTAAIGNLADPVELALAMPWRLPSGELASRAQVTAEWHALKARPELATYKASSPAVKNVTTIRLRDEDIIAVVTAKMLSNEKEMRKFFPQWDDFPADAQLALFSLSWACGADFEVQFKNCTNSANRGDWMSCAIEGKLKEAGNPGLVPRNKQQVLCFHNAAAAKEHSLDPETLFWPGAAPTVDADVHQEATQSLVNAPYALWEQKLDELTITALAGLDLSHSAADHETYNGDGTVSS